MQTVTFINIEILASGITFGYVIYYNTSMVGYKLPVLKIFHKRPFDLIYADAQGQQKSFQSIACHF